MNGTQNRILELFETLHGNEQQEIAEQLYQRARPTFLQRLTSEQSAEFEAGLAEADRGEGSTEHDVFARLEQRFGVKLA